MADITIDKACCKGCNICLTVCPKKIFIRSKKRSRYGSAMPDVSNTEECLVCRMCERLCPDGAINVEGEK
ncbi:MAG: 4Fe-4S binding protein [Firmicutes bacterium]|nr:4Fe-4S binding protein [Bacillota bacterium]